jgi:hypothetical protein
MFCFGIYTAIAVVFGIVAAIRSTTGFACATYRYETKMLRIAGIPRKYRGWPSNPEHLFNASYNRELPRPSYQLEMFVII